MKIPSIHVDKEVIDKIVLNYTMAYKSDNLLLTDFWSHGLEAILESMEARLPKQDYLKRLLYATETLEYYKTYYAGK